MRQTQYNVTTNHSKWPDGCGTFTLTVHYEPLPAGSEYGTVTGKRFVSGGPFGCSRDYFVANDLDAIAALLAEHATTIVKIVDASCPSGCIVFGRCQQECLDAGPPDDDAAQDAYFARLQAQASDAPETMEYLVSKRRNQFGEYVVRFWMVTPSGRKRLQDGDYFTEDRADAEATGKAECERHNANHHAAQPQ